MVNQAWRWNEYEEMLDLKKMRDDTLVLLKRRQTMEFRKIDTSLEKSSQEEKKTKPRHFFSNTPHEQEISSVHLERKLVIPPGPLPGGMKAYTKLWGSEARPANVEECYNKAYSHYKQACIHSERKEYREAKGECKQAKDLFGEVLENCKQDPLNTAIVKVNLADVYTVERNFGKAKGLYREVLAFFDGPR